MARLDVPSVWLTPDSRSPAPAALLLHGFSSSKERMAQSVGRELRALGVASLALDLPFHGERDGGRSAAPHVAAQTMPSISAAAA